MLYAQTGFSQITDTGDEVGIGTSNPDAKLEVRGTTSIGGAWNPSQSVFTISDGANDLIMDTNEIYSSGSLYLGSKAANVAIFRSITDTGNTDRVTIKSDGKVGIEISNPQATFHVVDNSPLGSNVGNFQILSRLQGKSNYNNFMDNIWLLRDDNGNDWLSTRLHNGISVDNSFLTPSVDTKTWWERDPWDNVQSWGNGSEVYMSLVKGKLGIGTTNPGSWKLAVNGNIRAKEVKVETGWSDFVFENDYNLPTLEEVEKYINEKRHLKDIPSAEEVAENGIFLGEMDAKLLQKIEELTLYAIQQEKELKAERAK